MIRRKRKDIFIEVGWSSLRRNWKENSIVNTTCGTNYTITKVFLSVLHVFIRNKGSSAALRICADLIVDIFPTLEEERLINTLLHIINYCNSRVYPELDSKELKTILKYGLRIQDYKKNLIFEGISFADLYHMKIYLQSELVSKRASGISYDEESERERKIRLITLEMERRINLH